MSGKSAYRADIDGLRAVAILPVVLFHAGVGRFAGGYVGVDVFFVISGFLITGVIARELKRGTFTYQQFYLRRAKRIVPALLLVLGASMLAGLVVMGPGELKELGKLVLATNLFVSNIVLWRDVGYFGDAAELKPLLMTWSLGVEEQFYLVWPILLGTTLRLRLRLSTLVLVVGVASFALAVTSVRVWPTPAFYLLPTRAWELLLGAWLAIPAIDGADDGWAAGRVRDIASVAGLLMVTVAVLGFDSETVFPGEAALIPCLGTALLIWSGQTAAVNRLLLSRRPVVLVGLISYSLYLWHWPLLAYGRILARGEMSAAATSGLVILSFALAYVTWRFVEGPFRQRSSVPPLVSLARFGVATAFGATFGLALLLAGGLPGRLSPAALAADASRRDINPLRALCLRSASVSGPPAPACLYGGPEGRYAAIWGDSHADALAPGLRAWFRAAGLGSLQFTADACPPLLGVDVLLGSSQVRGCRKLNDQTFARLAADQTVDTVILAARWPHYAHNSRFGAEYGQKAYLTDDTSAERSEANSLRAFAASLERAVDSLIGAGKRVVIVGPIPEMGRNIPDCLMRRHMRVPALIAGSGVEGGGLDCDVKASDVKARLAATSEVIERLATRNPRTITVWPERQICLLERCISSVDGVVIYSDDDHLSAHGAEFVAGGFAPLEIARGEDH